MRFSRTTLHYRMSRPSVPHWRAALQGRLAMRTVRVIAAVVMAVGFLSPPASADPTRTATIGGSGGSPFSSYCGPTAYLNQVEARTGAWIDGVYARCGVLGAGNQAFVSPLYPSYVGGLGGSGPGPNPPKLCPDANQVISQIEVEVVHVGGATYVSNLWADCRRIVSPGDQPGSLAVRTTPNAPDVVYERRGLLTCPAGKWAVGLYGTAGVYIDSIGLLCDFAPNQSLLTTRPSDVVAVQPCAFCASWAFPDPRSNGQAVDVCLNWGTNCGQPAADAFCVAQGFVRASSYAVQEDSPPTLVVGDGAVCNQSFCDRFSAITCAR